MALQIFSEANQKVALTQQSKLLSFATSRFQYIQLVNDTMNNGPEAFEKHSAHTTTAISSQIQMMKLVTPEVATPLLQMVEASCILQPHKEILNRAITSSVELDVTEAKPKNETQKQTNHFFHEYVQNNHECSVIAETTDVDTMMHFTAKLARLCGMNHPTEHTFAKMLATGFNKSARLHQQIIALQGDTGYDFLQKLKCFFRSMPKINEDGPMEYPAFSQLEAKHPNVFTNAQFQLATNDPILDRSLWPDLIRLQSTPPPGRVRALSAAPAR